MSKTILFVDGTSGFSPHRIKEKACGGIITSLVTIAEYLAKRGYDVVVGSAYGKEETVNGVKYIKELSLDLKPDIVVYNRNMVKNMFNGIFSCPKIWWLHDIVQLSYLKDAAFKQVDKIVALSKYCKKSYSDFYDIPEYKFETIPNGVDKDIFYFNGGERNPNLFICASAPIKGLKPIGLTYASLKRANPDVELRIYSSQKLHDLEDDEQTKKVFDKYRDLGIKILEPIPQKELADVMRQARGLLMPNHYPEICSNLILQAQACGCPVVTTPIGSAPEFIEHGRSGLLTKAMPHDLDWFRKDFAVNAVNLMQNDDLFKFISRTGTVDVFSWEAIGMLWNNLVKELI